MGKTVRIFALCLALLLLLAGCGAQTPPVSELPGPGTETVSASAAPEARYVYEEVELPEDVFISTAAELADGSLRFISAVSRFLEGEDGGSAFVSESSLWALSSSGEAEKLAVLSDAASEAFSARPTSGTRQRSCCCASARTARRPAAGACPSSYPRESTAASWPLTAPAGCA